jgi:hypothetical protein
MHQSVSWRLVQACGMYFAGSAAMSRPPKLPRYNLTLGERPGDLVLLVDGVPQASGLAGVMRVLVKRLRAADEALLKHHIDPQAEFPLAER